MIHVCIVIHRKIDYYHLLICLISCWSDCVRLIRQCSVASVTPPPPILLLCNSLSQDNLYSPSSHLSVLFLLSYSALIVGCNPSVCHSQGLMELLKRDWIRNMKKVKATSLPLPPVLPS